MEKTLDTNLPAATETISIQCQRLGHCKEHKPCCFCMEEKRVIADFLAFGKAA